MAFRNFIYEDDDDLYFLPKDPSLGLGIGSPSASVNTEPLKDVEEPEVQITEVTTYLGESLKADVFVLHPRSVATRIKQRKCKTREGSSTPLEKRKLASKPSSSHVVRAKTSGSNDDAVVDNVVNRRAHEFLQVIEKMSGEADVIKARERSFKEECKGL
nr:hypothetical protein [Tanacetum cinerariifolium]